MTIRTNRDFIPVAISGSFTVLFGVTAPLTRAVVTKLWLFNDTGAAIDVDIYVNDSGDLTTPVLVDTVSVGPGAGRSIQSVVGYSVPQGYYVIAAASGAGVNALYSTTDYSGNS
jgi:hypothetical protein